jgi:predicted O-methyltransferase YrrM
MATLRDAVAAARGVGARRLIREVARTPLMMRARDQIAALPTAQLADIVGTSNFEVSIAPVASRHDWSLGAAEQLVLQAVILSRRVVDVFEIGTFNGGTTRLLAETVPSNGRVVTMDLPPEEFDSTQKPAAFAGSEVGWVYRNSPAANKIEQLLENSLQFVSTRFVSAFDLVLVDGGHERPNGMADTRIALELVRPGGIILWDDFEPYWHGLVGGIIDEMRGRKIQKLAGTSFAVFVNA